MNSSDRDDNSSMSCSNTDRNTRDHNTRDRRTRDHSSMSVRSTSNRYPNNNPSREYPRGYRHTVSSTGVLRDGNGTDDVSDRNHQWRPCNPRYKNRHSPHVYLHIWCHEYIRWVHRPDKFRPHTGSDWFRRYNGGYTHRDHGLL